MLSEALHHLVRGEAKHPRSLFVTEALVLDGKELMVEDEASSTNKEEK
jgi:hypothetical protein